VQHDTVLGRNVLRHQSHLFTQQQSDDTYTK